MSGTIKTYRYGLFQSNAEVVCSQLELLDYRQAICPLLAEFNPKLFQQVRRRHLFGRRQVESPHGVNLD